MNCVAQHIKSRTEPGVYMIYHQLPCVGLWDLQSIPASLRDGGTNRHLPVHHWVDMQMCKHIFVPREEGTCKLWLGIKPRTFLLRDESVTHCNTTASDPRILKTHVNVVKEGMKKGRCRDPTAVRVQVQAL